MRLAYIIAAVHSNLHNLQSMSGTSLTTCDTYSSKLVQVLELIDKTNGTSANFGID